MSLLIYSVGSWLYYVEGGKNWPVGKNGVISNQSGSNPDDSWFIKSDHFWWQSDIKKER